MKGLGRRLATATVFAFVVIGSIIAGPWTFGMLFALVTVLAINEFYVMLDVDNPDPIARIGRRIYAICLGTIGYFAAFFYHMGQLEMLSVESLLSVFAPLVFIMFLIELYWSSKQPFRHLGYLALSFSYLAIPLALLPFIAFHSGSYEPWMIIGVLLLIWASDSGAYLGGSLYGKTKLFPRISPNKTWEGSLTGVAFTMIVAALLGYFSGSLTLAHWLAVGAIIAVFGPFGDLVESMLKRSLAIKDSGKLLPGHGGILDRFDAFIFVLPFVYAYLYWFA